MTVKVEYTSDGIGIVVVHEGVVAWQDLHASISKVFADERYEKLKYWVGDRTAITKFLIDTDGARQLASLSIRESMRNPGMLLALVSPKDFEFGMSRMFQVLSEENKFKTAVFRDRASAETWIQKCLNEE